MILHDFSPHSDCCVNCGQHIVNSTPECVPTTSRGATMSDLIASDFDRARQEMLAEFRRLIAASPEIAVREAEAALSAMRQLFQLETAHA